MINEGRKATLSTTSVNKRRLYINQYICMHEVTYKPVYDLHRCDGIACERTVISSLLYTGSSPWALLSLDRGPEYCVSP